MYPSHSMLNSNPEAINDIEANVNGGKFANYDYSMVT